MITVVVVGLLLFKLQPKNILTAFAQADLYWLALTLLIGVAMVGLRWLKWHLLVRKAVGITSPKQTFASLLGGMAVAIVTPARVGELSRVAFLKSNRRAEAGGLVVVDRFIDLIVMLIFAAAGVLVLFQDFSLLALLSLIVCFLLFTIFKLKLFLQLGKEIVPSKRIKDLLDAASTGLGRLSSFELGLNLFLTVSLTSLDVISLHTLVRSLGVDNFKAVAFVYPLIMLTNLLPITISGLGVRESTSILLFSKFAVSSAVAFNATFLSYVINSLTPAIFGIYFFRGLKVVNAKPSENHNSSV